MVLREMLQDDFILKYGQKEIKFAIPKSDLVKTIEPREPNAVGSENRIIEDALLNPINSPLLEEIVQPGEKVVLVVSDITRETGSKVYLPAILSRLNKAGVKDSNVSIVVATGNHRKHTINEQRKIVGEEVFSRVRIYDHDSLDENNLVYVGTTKCGTPIQCNRYVLEADKVVLTGAINFHDFAGFSGGRKSILPGICSHQTCAMNHSLALDYCKCEKHPLAKAGILEGNPVHEDMADACDIVRPAFLLNTILSTEGRVIKAVAGHYAYAFEEGCEFLMRNYSVNIDEQADLVIVSCGGYPRDVNFIQAYKTIEFTLDAVREGGAMIVLAQSMEGLGSKTFCNWLEHKTQQEYIDNLRRNYEIGGYIAYLAKRKTEKVRIILMSELSDEEVRKLSMIPAHSTAEALYIACSILDSIHLAYIIPRGGSVLTVLNQLSVGTRC